MKSLRSEKPKIPEVVKLFSVYKKNNPTWGSLHIVLDDGNVSDADVEFCIKFADDHNDSEGMILARILQQMSKTQRTSLDRKVDEYLEGER